MHAKEADGFAKENMSIMQFYAVEFCVDMLKNLLKIQNLDLEGDRSSPRLIKILLVLANDSSSNDIVCVRSSNRLRNDRCRNDSERA